MPSPFMQRLKETRPEVYDRIHNLRRKSLEQRRFNQELESALFWKKSIEELEVLNEKAKDGLAQEDMSQLLRIFVGALRRM
jgi:hypothetical protein